MGPHLFQVGAVWHYRFQVGGARRQRSTRQTSRRRADEIAMQAYEDARRVARGQQPVPTLAQLAGQWIETHGKTVSASHLKGMQELRRLHLYGLADVLIDRITTADVEHARAQHAEAHAAGTVNHWLRLLRLLFKWAVRRKVIAEVPWTVKPLKVQQRPRAILPQHDAHTWLCAIDALRRPVISTAVRLMLGLGLREIEVRTARWEWVDWDRRTYTPGQTKGREAVPVPMPDWLVEYLTPLWTATGLIVANRRGAEFSPGFASRAIRAANRKSGVEGLTPHRLRGTFATTLSEAGVPVQALQRVMRHKNVLTTIGYLEVDLDRVVRAQQQVAERMRFDELPHSASSGESA